MVWLVLVLLFMIYLEVSHSTEAFGAVCTMFLLPALWAGVPAAIVFGVMLWLTHNASIALSFGVITALLVLGWLCWTLVIAPRRQRLF